MVQPTICNKTSDLSLSQLMHILHLLEMSDLLVVFTALRDVWRYLLMTLGAPYVMIGLAQKKQLLSVGSWDLKRQVRKHGEFSYIECSFICPL